LQSTWVAVLRQPRHQIVDLAKGSGQWLVNVDRGASIKQLYAKLPSFVEHLIATGYSAVDADESWWSGEPVTTARSLGIAHIELLDNGGPDQAVFGLWALNEGWSSIPVPELGGNTTVGA
jgi:hypothetical protein